MNVVLVVKRGYENTGVGRYANQLRAALESLGHEIVLVHPIVPLPKLLMDILQRFLGWDLEAFFNNYPIWAHYPQADIYHITSQNLVTLMLLRRPPGPTVITVHDIIPWLVRDDLTLCNYNHFLDEWFDKLSLVGLRRADGLVADSAFTQKSLRCANVVVGTTGTVVLGVE